MFLFLPPFAHFNPSFKKFFLLLVNWPSFVWPGSRGASKGWVPPPGYSPHYSEILLFAHCAFVAREWETETRNCDIMSRENQLPSSIISTPSTPQKG